MGEMSMNKAIHAAFRRDLARFIDALGRFPAGDRGRAEELAAALAAIQELQRVTVQHMDHEETEIEQAYLTNKDAAEIKAMGRQFAKVGPAEGGTFFAWVLDGAGPEESAAITGTIPKPVLAIISGLFGRGYRKNVAPV